MINQKLSLRGYVIVKLTLCIILTFQLTVTQGMQSTNPVPSTNNICALTISSDGKTILGSTESGHNYLWQIDNTLLLNDFVTTGSCAYSVFSSDGTQLFTFQPGDMTGQGGEAILWNIETGKAIQHFKGRAILSDDGQLLLTSEPTTHDQLWDVTSGDLLYTFDTPVHAITGAAFSPDHTKLLTSNWPVGQAELWDLTSHMLLHTFPQKQVGWVSLVRFLPDSQHALIRNDGDDVTLWDLANFQSSFTFPQSANIVRFFFFSRDDQMMMAGYDDKGNVRIWETTNGTIFRELATGISYMDITDAIFSADGEQFLVALRDGSVQLWDVELGSMIQQYIPKADLNIDWDTTHTVVAFSPDGDSIAVGYSNEPVQIWNLQTGEEVKSYSLP